MSRKPPPKKQSGIGGFVVVIIVLFLLGKANAVPIPGLSHARHSSVTECSYLERLWEREGGSPSAAFMAAEIAMAESGGDPGSTGYNTNGTVDRGLWQINSIWGSMSTYDVYANARAAVSISNNGTDWSPWTTYNNGAYAGRC